MLQGAYGGATMAGGGLALMIVPALTDARSWRATHASAPPLGLATGLPVAVIFEAAQRLRILRRRPSPSSTAAPCWG